MYLSIVYFLASRDDKYVYAVKSTLLAQLEAVNASARVSFYSH